MAPRPTWQGHPRLSLVTCPVALYTATSPTGDVDFNMPRKETHNRVAACFWMTNRRRSARR
jgi:DNA end-binding protein Ku